MGQHASVISFASAAAHHSVLLHIKKAVAGSPHPYEQTAHQFIGDLEALYEDGTLSFCEFMLVSGKAADVLDYFRYEVAQLKFDDSGQRPGIIHQLCCAMLQALRMLRPDLDEHAILGETAYNLYCYRLPASEAAPLSTHRPLKGRNWLHTPA